MKFNLNHFRSSDDDDYESGDDVPTFDVLAPR